MRKAITNKGGLNGTTRFLWGADSDWQCLEERDADDDLVARFTYSPGYPPYGGPLAVQERDLNSDTDFADTNEVVYYEQNTLFSVYALSDGDGSVIERYRYDAYGGVTVLDPDGSVDGDGLSDVRNPYVFTGRRLDSETGLMQYRHRYYSSVLGRFLSRDRDGASEARALAEYAGSRPTVGRDPSGRTTQLKKAYRIDIGVGAGPTDEQIEKAVRDMEAAWWTGAYRAPPAEEVDALRTRLQESQYLKHQHFNVGAFYDPSLRPPSEGLLWEEELRVAVYVADSDKTWADRDAGGPPYSRKVTSLAAMSQAVHLAREAAWIERYKRSPLPWPFRPLVTELIVYSHADQGTLQADGTTLWYPMIGSDMMMSLGHVCGDMAEYSTVTLWGCDVGTREVIRGLHASCPKIGCIKACTGKTADFFGLYQWCSGRWVYYCRDPGRKVTRLL